MTLPHQTISTYPELYLVVFLRPFGHPQTPVENDSKQQHHTYSLPVNVNVCIHLVPVKPRDLK